MGIGEDLGLECWQAKMNDGQKLSIDEGKEHFYETTRKWTDRAAER